MKEISLKSGKVLKINLVDFDTAFELKRVVQEAFIKIDVDIDIDMSELRNGNLLNVDISSSKLLNSLKNMIFAIDSSREFRDVLFQCLERCTYDKEKITKETFNSEEARGDYYEIAWRCLEKNLSPFFKNLLMNLEPLTQIIKNSQSISSEETKK